ncbi:cupin domain-containing protein [Arhodomonas sp. SL1]|uniref:cupin domain-containing protein n=1 Tax=Arhodomonas sp. SL1 TaxID=3425691 RepID=UPI003F881BB2
MSTDQPGAEELARLLHLEPHVEGGYFRRTYQAEGQPRVPMATGRRYLMTSIHYLLTADAPVGHFHRNRSDIIHFFHLGDPIRYYLLDEDGRMETVDLGPDLAAGQCLQLAVPGGVWKASELLAGPAGHGLISEAVAPGFEYEDMTLARRDELARRFPAHADTIARLTRP